MKNIKTNEENTVVKISSCNSTKDKNGKIISAYENAIKSCKEGQIMKEFEKCPSICPIEQYFFLPTNKGEDIYYLYLIMEYYNEGSLEDYMNEKKNYPIEEKRIIKWIYSIINGIVILHKSNIIHRDLKPGNIFLNKGEILLGDFGISIKYDEKNKSITKGIGTYRYMSPELQNEQDYNESVDIWAIGCILFELLSGIKFNCGTWKSNFPFSNYSDKINKLLDKLLSIKSIDRPNAITIQIQLKEMMVNNKKRIKIKIE